MARKSSAKASTKEPESGLNEDLRRRLREAGVLLLVPLAGYLLLCLFSYSPLDPSWSHAAQAGRVHNFGGMVGAWIADLLRYLFGVVAYAFPLLLLALGLKVLRRDVTGDETTPYEPALRLVGFVVFFVVGPALAALDFGHYKAPPEGTGGVLGRAVSANLGHAFGSGTSLFLLALLLIAVTLATGLSWFRVMDTIGRGVLAATAWAGARLRRAPDYLAARAARAERTAVKKSEAVKQAKREPIRIEPVVPRVEKSERATRESQIPLFKGSSSKGELPPLSLLDEPPPQGPGYSEEALEVLSRQVELKLKDFRIEARVVGVYPGPGDHPLRAGAGARRARQPGVEPGQGHRPRPVGGQRARGRRDPGQERDRPGDPQHQARDRVPVGNPALEGVRQRPQSRCRWRWARTSAASRWSSTWPRCRTCWWPAPPDRASRWRSMP